MMKLNVLKNIFPGKARHDIYVTIASTLVNSARFKATFNKASDTSNSEQSEDIYPSDKTTTTMQIKISNTRVDLIIKSGLGIARNKIEKLFFDNKIRVNGQKIGKKSEQIEEGDEIDVIKGPSPNNPEHLVVARVEILSMKPEEETISVKIRRSRSLLVESKYY
ncbi:mitochondrial transcription rescue factor 1 [Coccinella septempunctata]|uniref:mitochondrial transcription rescue factor 1 n=1 Tax=Coccinella septempunctata TaxID=41139 RepID=UPI001D08912A|nr:mitochondrial transcription rescue factor 1 [Coccinella septempunctata]XP_044755730.1 mitochondrial transcription rescue factor 1 [Coccinella septempunctata]